MQQYLIPGNDLTGGVSPNPSFPNIISLDMDRPLRDLFMYTNNLRELAAPRELCVQKALELINSRVNYEINLATFRMELLAENIGETGEEDVNALILGIQCLCEYLLANFDNHSQLSAEFFPYEFYCLHLGRYLFLSKITFDATLSPFRPATIAQPAYTNPQVQGKIRADYITETNQFVIL